MSYTLTNFSGQTPLDLCPDPNLCKTLTSCRKEGSTLGNDSITEGEASNPPQASGSEVPQERPQTDPTADECLVCSDAKRDTLFRPCGHICCCNVCAARVRYFYIILYIYIFKQTNIYLCKYSILDSRHVFFLRNPQTL